MTIVDHPKLREATRLLLRELKVHSDAIGTVEDIRRDGRHLNLDQRRVVMGELIAVCVEMRQTLVDFLKVTMPDAPLIESLGELERHDLPRVLPGVICALLLENADGSQPDFIELNKTDPTAFADAVRRSVSAMQRRDRLARKTAQLETL